MVGYLLAGFFIGRRDYLGAGTCVHALHDRLEIDLKKIVRARPVILLAGGAQSIGGCILGALLFAAVTPAILRYDVVYLSMAAR
jgi:hypothetical protein